MSDARIEVSIPEGRIASSGPWLHLPDHRVQLSPDALETVRRVTGAEAAHWPQLAAGAAAQKEDNDG